MATDFKMTTPSIRGGVKEMRFQHAAVGRGTVLLRAIWQKVSKP